MKLLILSDIHANYPALEAVINVEKKYNKIIFLGDVVDYGPHPKECIEFVKNNVDYAICGNHDYALAFNKDCNSMNSFREYSVETRKWHKNILSQDDIKFLQSLPIEANINIAEKYFFLTHATPFGGISKYLTESELEEEIRLLPHKYVLLGHTYRQYSKYIYGTFICNPGSVSLSRESNKACYAVLENDKFILKHIDYDVQLTINDLMKSPIPQHCKEGLSKILMHN